MEYSVSTTEEALGGEDDDSSKNAGTDDSGSDGYSEWQQIRQLMLTIFYDIYILENV